jgi:hypothetical protein
MSYRLISVSGFDVITSLRDVLISIQSGISGNDAWKRGKCWVISAYVGAEALLAYHCVIAVLTVSDFAHYGPFGSAQLDHQELSLIMAIYTLQSNDN